MNPSINKRQIIKLLFFSVFLALLLMMVSWLSVQMNRNTNPLYNYSSRCIFTEPDNSIDVLFIGDSNTYSAISPLQIWKNHGISSYSWGEPSQRIAETHQYLKQIFRHQKPKAVFLEVGNLFQDRSLSSSLDSSVKARIARFFPVVTYHKRLDYHRIPTLTSDKHSITKGYFLRKERKKIHKRKHREKNTDEKHPISSVNQWELQQCIRLCKNNNCEVYLLTVPSYTGWNTKKHNALAEQARKNQVELIDLNVILANEINWTKDTPDAGVHLNIYGADKVSNWLGDYLAQNLNLMDHRPDPAYAGWHQDLQDYEEALATVLAPRPSKKSPKKK